MKEIIIKASKKYPIVITDSLVGLKELLSKKLNNANKVLVISDSNVFPLYGGAVLERIEAQAFSFVVPSGENSKNFENYFNILNYLAEHGFSRSDAVIGLGGGVVGDLASFVASTYMRGISYIAIPTTILAFVDSSVGGKTAINLSQGKNLVGSFYQPNAVFINMAFYKTLPDREVKSGWGEIAKYYFLASKISDNELIGGLTEDIIYKCLQIKSNIVETDEFDMGKRKLLNFGHTFGHAIEKLSSYKLSHGECVVKGIYISLLVSKHLLKLSQERFDKAKCLLEKLGYNLINPYSLEDISRVIRLDKKASGDSVDFVLLDELGELTCKKISFDKLIEAAYEY